MHPPCQAVPWCVRLPGAGDRTRGLRRPSACPRIGPDTWVPPPGVESGGGVFGGLVGGGGWGENDRHRMDGQSRRDGLADVADHPVTERA